MRIKNLIFSVSLTIPVYIIANSVTNFNPYSSIYLAIATFILSYWVARTIGRVRYWVGNGTRGVYSVKCPNCDRKRHRVSGDWILKCHECGWRRGYPIIRWFTKSVPAVQFKRSISNFESLLFGFFISPVVFNHNLKSLRINLSIPDLPNSGIYIDPILDVLGIVLVVIAILFIILIFREEPRMYCRDCGQDMGKGQPDGKCSRCGCNRFTDEDPGVGRTTKVKKADDK